MAIVYATDEGLGVYLPGLAKHGTAYKDTDTGKVYLTLPERLPFQDRDDTTIHVCKGGERLVDVAVMYYQGSYSSAVDLWPVIAEFQEDPIIDPFIPLETGRLILIPSVAYVTSVAFGDSLREFPVV